jgi:hypothetical protein
MTKTLYNGVAKLQRSLFTINKEAEKKNIRIVNPIKCKNEKEKPNIIHCYIHKDDALMFIKNDGKKYCCNIIETLNEMNNAEAFIYFNEVNGKHDDLEKIWKNGGKYNHIKHDNLKFRCLSNYIAEWKDLFDYEKQIDKVNDELYEIFKCYTTTYNSYSQITYRHWFNTLINRRGENKLKSYIALPETMEEEYMYRNAIYPGRVESFVGEWKSEDIDSEAVPPTGLSKSYDEIDDYLLFLDFNSFYPYCMKNYEYPYGKMYEYNDKNPNLDCFGIYKVKMTPPDRNDIQPILPRRQSRRSNGERKDGKKMLYDFTESVGYYTNIDIKLGMKYGYKFEFLGEGYFWRQTGDLFSGYIDKLYSYKKKGYKTAKKLMNMLFGSLHQRPKMKLIEIEKEDRKNYNKSFYENGKFFAYEKENIEIEDCHYPAYLAAFILSYSRVEMANLMEKCNFDYYRIHTDSIIVSSKYKSSVEEMLGDELGALKNEICDSGKIIEAEFVNNNKYKLTYIKPDGSFGVKETKHFSTEWS